MLAMFSFSRSIFKRSLSDGNILGESGSPMSAKNVKHSSNSVLPERSQGSSNFLSESSPEISTCESDTAFSRFVYLTLSLLDSPSPFSICLEAFSFSVLF